MKSLSTFIFILVIVTSYGQPGDIHGTAILRDSISFIVIDEVGDTVTPNDTNFKISLLPARGSDGPYPQHLIGISPYPTYTFGSNGIIRDKDSVTFNIFDANYDSRIWLGAWIIDIRNEDSVMKIYVDNMDGGIELPGSSGIFHFHFTPGYYYLLRQPREFMEDGYLITHSLISLKETQTDQLEEIFNYYLVREKLGMSQ